MTGLIERGALIFKTRFAPYIWHQIQVSPNQACEMLLCLIQGGMKSLTYCVLSNSVDKITSDSKAVLLYIALNYVLHRLWFEEEFEEAESLCSLFPLKKIFKNFIKLYRNRL